MLVAASADLLNLTVQNLEWGISLTFLAPRKLESESLTLPAVPRENRIVEDFATSHAIVAIMELDQSAGPTHLRVGSDVAWELLKTLKPVPNRFLIRYLLLDKWLSLSPLLEAQLVLLVLPMQEKMQESWPN